MNRDEKGRFISAKAGEMIAAAKDLTAEAEKLISVENEPPVWLKKLIVAIALELDITADEFTKRVKVVHPTPLDPVLLVDGKTIISWI